MNLVKAENLSEAGTSTWSYFVFDGNVIIFSTEQAELMVTFLSATALAFSAWSVQDGKNLLDQYAYETKS